MRKAEYRGILIFKRQQRHFRYLKLDPGLTQTDQEEAFWLIDDYFVKLLKLIEKSK